MKHTSVAATMRASHIPARARIAATRILAGSLVAGFIIGATTVSGVTPAGAAVASSKAMASSKPAPRAFFGLGPATKGKIDGRTYFNWGGSPGSYLSDEVELVNFGAIPVTITAFVTTAESTPHGQTVFLPQGKAHGGLAAWVKLHMPHGSPTITLAPGAKVIVPVTAVFPKNAQPGDHVGAIVASLSSVIQSKNHAKVHLVQNVADRIILRITGRLQPRLSVTGLQVAYNDPLNPVATRPATLSFNILNSGNEVLGGHVSVSVTGLVGGKTRHDIVSVPAMLPGGSDSARVTVDGVYPAFLETGQVTIQPLVPTGQFDGKRLKPYVGQVSFWAIPWIPLVIVILLVLLPVGLWYRRRRRRAASKVSAGQPSAVISGGTA